MKKLDLIKNYFFYKNDEGENNKRSGDKIKILYLHNLKGWAIYNVGILWLKNNGFDVTFKSFGDVSEEELSDYDFVWYGYLAIFFRMPTSLDKAILTVHDPAELFSTHKKWKDSFIPLTFNFLAWKEFFKYFIIRRLRLRLLKKAHHVITASEEMKVAMKKHGIRSHVIPTTTNIAEKKSKKRQGKLSFYAVTNDGLRKNYALLREIMEFCRENDVGFEIKTGLKILTTEKYIEALDRHNLYICTSLQEGGPLPAMDAMSRGLIVLTTPVGQIQDMIKNGKNGFICEELEDFKKAILFLKNNMNSLEEMSRLSKEEVKKRSPGSIRANVSKYVRGLRL